VAHDALRAIRDFCPALARSGSRLSGPYALSREDQRARLTWSPQPYASGVGPQRSRRSSRTDVVFLTHALVGVSPRFRCSLISKVDSVVEPFEELLPQHAVNTSDRVSKGTEVDANHDRVRRYGGTSVPIDEPDALRAQALGVQGIVAESNGFP